MKKLIVLIVFLICILIFSGCKINDNNMIYSKVEDEIDYIENEILIDVNKYIKEEYFEGENIINWNSINNDFQKINGTLDTIMIDLSELQISNEELISFRNNLNNILIAIGNEDEKEFLDSCSYFYSYLPIFLGNISSDVHKINIITLKSYILLCYTECNFLDWNGAKETIILAENKYNEMINDAEFMQEYSYNLNRAYIVLEEFKSAVETENLELVKNKYINFIEEF